MQLQYPVKLRSRDFAFRIHIATFTKHHRSILNCVNCTNVPNKMSVSQGRLNKLPVVVTSFYVCWLHLFVRLTNHRLTLLWMNFKLTWHLNFLKNDHCKLCHETTIDLFFKYPNIEVIKITSQSRSEYKL